MIMMPVDATFTFILLDFSRKRGKGLSFYFGGLGLRRVRSSLLCRPQASATVRDDCAMAMPIATAEKVV
jgi:hypothetical protein